MKSKTNKALESIGAGVIVALAVGLIAFILPIISVVTGWFAGTIIKLVFGSYITNGLNLLFNTSRFTPDSIPVICSTLAVIGSYFKSTQTNKSK